MTWSSTKSAAIATIAGVGLVAGTTLVTRADSKPATGQAEARITNQASGTTTTKRRVKASGDLTLGISITGATASVGIGEPRVSATGKVTHDHVLLIEPKKLLLDGKLRSKLPASTAELEVICTNHIVSILADKKFLLSARLEK